jgi:hypothetical protein
VWRIRDVNPGSLIRTVSIPDPGTSSKNLSILTPKKAKKWFPSLKIMIWVVHPGSRIRMLTFSHPGSRIEGSKRHPIPDPQHCGIRCLFDPGSGIMDGNIRIEDKNPGSATLLAIFVKFILFF